MDRLLSLSVFVAAVDEGSIAAAARRHGLSAVMAGRYLAALEASLPARLLQRTTRRLSLTDAGTAYYARCKRVLEELDEADHEAAETHSTPHGTLKIAAPITFGAMYLGPVVAAYMKEFPVVKVEVHLQDRFVDLIEEGLDLAVRVGRLRDSDLVARRIANCALIACATPAYLRRRGTPKTPADLVKHERIGYIGTVSTPPWSFERADGEVSNLTEPCRFTANNTQLMAEMALGGFGVAYGPMFVFATHLASRALVQVLPGYTCPDLPVHAITPTAKHVAQKARYFIDRLTRAFGPDDAPWERWRKPAARAASRAR